MTFRETDVAPQKVRGSTLNTIGLSIWKKKTENLQ